MFPHRPVLFSEIRVQSKTEFALFIRPFPSSSFVDTPMPKREQIEQMLSADPEDIFLNYALGMALVSEGRPADAARQFDKVIELDASYVAAYFQSGQALAQAGRVNEAKAMLKRGIIAAAESGDQHAEAEMTAFLESL